MTNEHKKRRRALAKVAMVGIDVSSAVIDSPLQLSSQLAEVANAVADLALETVRLLDENARLRAEVDRLSVPWWRRLLLSIMTHKKPKSGQLPTS